MDDQIIFEHEILPDPTSHIRILVLEPGARTAPLRASLETIPLQTAGAYNATSYCWGTTVDGVSDESCEILLSSEAVVEKRRKRISRRLDLLLRRFRDVHYEVRLWNDAICIDQTDYGAEERAKQVRLMTNIYSSARKVLVYLGEADEHTPQAIELIGRIERAARNTPRDDQRTSAQWISDNGIPRVNESTRWEPLKAFFRRDWFRRKWIIQECVVAVEPIFFCGEWTMSWDSMQLVIHTLYRHGLGIHNYTTYSEVTEGEELQQGLKAMRYMAKLKEAWKQNCRYPIMEIAYQMQLSQAKDERDHLFALLGLTVDGDAEELDPNYKDYTFCENSIRYARYFLKRQENLEVLYRAGMQGQTLLAPSWVRIKANIIFTLLLTQYQVPNWYGAHSGSGAEFLEGFWHPHQRPSFYNIAGNSMTQLIDTGNSEVLGVKGRQIDWVTRLANRYTSSIKAGRSRSLDSFITEQQEYLKECDQIMSEMSSYPTNEAPSDVLWRTLICNLTFDGQIAPPSYEDSYKAWKRQLLWDDQRASLDREQQPFRKVIDEYNNDKVFGMTRNGYVGMFPRATLIDDSIFVLSGGEFPFVLRGKKDQGPYQWELVGQCYIHGLMEPKKTPVGFDLKNFKLDVIRIG